MARKRRRKKTPKSVESITHDKASRKYIPTAEFQSVLEKETQDPLQIAYERRNRDLDPQLIWRGKDLQNWSDLIVPVPPLYIQEKIHPKVLIDDLIRMTKAQEKEGAPQQTDMFADFNGLPSQAARTEFYQHEANWSNRMILGDSLQVMASLAEREGLRGKVQCIYIDPPYGIKFNSNFQWSTTSRSVRDGRKEHITREPEQVKAFRDTWRDGIHSYLTYLRDRLTVARDLLTESGSVFVQIGDENVHRVRALMDEVFGEENFTALIPFGKVSGLVSNKIPQLVDYIVWYAKSAEHQKVHRLFNRRTIMDDGAGEYRYVELPSGEIVSGNINKIRQGYGQRDDVRFLRPGPLTSQDFTEKGSVDYSFRGKTYHPGFTRHWSVAVPHGLNTLGKAGRLVPRKTSLSSKLYLEDNPAQLISNTWMDTSWGFETQKEKVYVVQTHPRVAERCVLMSTDPGDLVIDPTCGSGTTAYVAEQWGRRWITIDTSRVALALARARIMGARYPYYLLKDSREGQHKEAQISRTIPSEEPTYSNIRQGFVYERVPHVTLKAIANNAEIDVIWETFQAQLEPLRAALNQAVGKNWEEWEITREVGEDWTQKAQDLHAQWWEQRIARQKEIDASIAAKANYEYLYDKPYVNNKKVRVAGPFTVESLSPHRILGVDEDDELIDLVAEGKAGYGKGQNFCQMILENLKTAGVQQAHKEDKINFTSLTPWPGHYICAEGRYLPSPRGRGAGGEGEGEGEKRAGVFIGPEFGTVARPDLVAAAREAGESGFDVLIACAFNYDARSTEFNKLGRIPILKARMNAELHMADDLKNTGKGNLFVIFGEPDIEILDAKEGQIKVKINGVDVFHPSTGEVRSDGAEGIALWFIDTDYNEESFFVRHAYFLGANDPYKSLKTTLKAEINQESWESLHSDTSRPFDKPASGRIAVKAINHLGDEVMKVFKVR